MKQNEEKFFNEIFYLVEKYGSEVYSGYHLKQLEDTMKKLIAVYQSIFNDTYQLILTNNVYNRITSINTSIMSSYFTVNDDNIIEFRPHSIHSADMEIQHLYTYKDKKEISIDAKFILFNLLWNTSNKIYFISFEDTESGPTIQESHYFHPYLKDGSDGVEKYLCIDVTFDRFDYDDEKYKYAFIMIVDSENRLLYSLNHDDFYCHGIRADEEFFSLDIMKVF
jgi:hypothetical protein